MCWHSRARAALFFPCYFSPLEGWQVFQRSGAGRAGRGRWQLQPLHLRAGRQPAPGPCATALLGATATGNAAPALGKRQHTRIRHSAVTPPSFLADSEPLELQTVLLPHTAPEKPTCAVLLARKEHMQILQMSKYLNFKTNEG